MYFHGRRIALKKIHDDWDTGKGKSRGLCHVDGQFGLYETKVVALDVRGRETPSGKVGAKRRLNYSLSYSFDHDVRRAAYLRSLSARP